MTNFPYDSETDDGWCWSGGATKEDRERIDRRSAYDKASRQKNEKSEGFAMDGDCNIGGLGD